MSETRTFIGDGTGALRVPGLLKIEQVAHAPKAIALEQTVIHPIADQPATPLYPEKLAGSESFIRRDWRDHDGIWTRGQEYLVTGEFVPLPEPIIELGESTHPVITEPEADKVEAPVETDLGGL